MNPYRQRRTFVGRQAELAVLSDLLGAGQSALLIGGRRTGKTTLLERLPDPGRAVMHCDAAAWNVQSEADIRTALAAAVNRAIDGPVSRPELETVLREAAPLVVAIDEADRLLGEPWSGGFLSFLRYLDDSALRSDVSFLLVGGPMLSAYRNPDDRGSPPLNTAEQVFLGPLAYGDVEELAAVTARPLDLIPRLWVDAGGHPQLLSGLLARVYDGRDYDDSVDILTDAALRDFAVWHRQLGEQGRAFLRELPDHGVTRQELASASWMPLREGYVLARSICLVRAEANRVRPGPRLFTDWLKAQNDHKWAAPKWDLAISYASEDVKLAAAIHKGLRDHFDIFFAAEQEAYLWGAQLGDALPQIYGEQSRFVLVLSSEAYLAKYWPRVEFRAAKQRLGDSLLVVDAGMLPPDLPSDLVYRQGDAASMVSLLTVLRDRLTLPIKR